jgi:hypothetical protein
MNLYVQHLNIKSKILYERQLKEHKDQLRLADIVDAVPTPEPSGTNAPDDTDGTTMNTLNPQIIFLPQHQGHSPLRPPDYFRPPIPRTFSCPYPRTSSPDQSPFATNCSKN